MPVVAVGADKVTADVGIEAIDGGGMIPPAPIATDGVGITICNGSSGCGVEPSLTARLGAES